MSDNDIIVCFELPCNSQQSRSYKKQPDDAFILPLFLCDVMSFRYNSFSRGAVPFGYPSVVVIDRNKATTLDTVYDAVLERLERWTKNARDLYTWEAGTLEEAPIRINGLPPVDNHITEIKENGDVIEIQEEGDITDAKQTILEDDDIAMGNVAEIEPRRTTTKKDVFNLRMQANHKDFGTALGYGGNIQRFESWDHRVNDAESDVILRENDALFAEFDENMKAYYFGDERSRWEHARWDEWEEFIHPEYAEARKTSAAMKNKGISIQDCLDEFTHEEKLGEDDLWYCPRCKKHQQATKKFDLWKAPDVLVVHLKRFSNSRALRDKIDTFVDFPVTGLDLSDMVGERLIAKKLHAEGVDVTPLGLGDLDEPLIYDLFGVDEHMGGLGGGHYRAYALNHVTEKWYHFDDSYVRTANASDAVVSTFVTLLHLSTTDVLVFRTPTHTFFSTDDVQIDRWAERLTARLRKHVSIPKLAPRQKPCPWILNCRPHPMRRRLHPTWELGCRESAL
jgi:ubiquitin carboxyl-terminal hydrolase 4/11